MTSPGSPAATLDSGAMVLDVSLSCAWCFADEASEAAWVILARLRTAPAPVPSLWLLKTANVLLQAERRSRITAAAIRTFLGLLESLPIHIDHAGTATIWHDTLALARAHRLTSYDAAYLELALRLGLPLASRDQALQAAARREGVPLLAWLPIEAVIRSRQQGYYESLGQADQLGDLEPFVTYQLEAIHDALRSEIGSEMRSEIDAVILRDLAAAPTLSARRLAGRLLRHGSPRAGSWQVL